MNRATPSIVRDIMSRLIGFISEQDVMGRVLDSIYHDDEAPLVKEMMRHEVLSVSPNKSITDLAQEMLGPKPKVYPVVEQQRLIGIVTRRDILVALLAIRRH